MLRNDLYTVDSITRHPAFRYPYRPAQHAIFKEGISRASRAAGRLHAGDDPRTDGRPFKPKLRISKGPLIKFLVMTCFPEKNASFEVDLRYEIKGGIFLSMPAEGFFMNNDIMKYTVIPYYVSLLHSFNDAQAIRSW